MSDRGIVNRLRGILGSAAGYSLFVHLIGGRSVRDTYIRDYIKATRGEKALDIGCGPGDILEYLPEMQYTGFDISPDYIAAAQQRFGNRARFFCGDVGLVTLEQEEGTFDLVLATGIVHHLSDDEAGRLFELARRSLRPGGRLITFDGCYVPGQSRIARWMLDKDRGRFVRDRDAYVRLASRSFSKVEADLRHDLLRVPYTHLILRCSEGRAPEKRA